jgi:hypothetical protein
MSAPVSLPTTAAWVWHTGPRPVPGLDAVFVRCAHGASGSGSGNFDFARNWRRWKADGRTRAIPWTWFGPPSSSNGSACADVLHQIAPGEPLYIVEIEYDPPAEQVITFARRMRKLEPNATLGFTSYPSRAEAEARGGVPWDACVEAFDFGLPQVYNPRQRATLLKMNSPVVADMEDKPIHVAVFPDADAGWTESAQLGLLRHLGTSGWSLDQSSFERWRPQLAALAEERLAPGGLGGPGAPSRPGAPDARAGTRSAPGPRAARPGTEDVPGTQAASSSRPRPRDPQPGPRDAGPGPRDAGPGSRDARPGPRDARPGPATGPGVAGTGPGGRTGPRPGADRTSPNEPRPPAAAAANSDGTANGDSGASLADPGSVARALVEANGDQIAARVIAVVEQHVLDGGSLSDERLVAAVKRVLREGLGASGPEDRRPA